MKAALHPSVSALEGFLGTWRGSGEGHYPTIEDFRYEEEIVFAHAGKPLLSYSQRTWSADGTPMHSESGYLRGAGDRYEFIIAHAFGSTEISEGRFEGQALRLSSMTIAHASTADEIEAIERIFRVEADILSYDVMMAAARQPMTHHLAATLKRVT